MKVIKWLGVGVIILLTVAVVVVKFVAPPIIKTEAEKALTKQWGAEVNIGAVEIQLFPVGVTVRQVQLTNPDKADENLIVVERLYAEPALMDTLSKGFSPIQPIVDQVVVQGVQLHQRRVHAGKVVPAKPDPLTEKTNALVQRGLPAFKLPDPDKILKTEPLKTIEAAERLRREINRLQQQWAQLQRDLPDEKTLTRYQRQIEQLQKSELTPQTLQQLQRLKAEMERQKEKLAQAQQLLAGVDDLNKQLNRLKILPQQDMQALQQKYTFNAQGMGRLMQTLLGDLLQDYLQVGGAWVAKLKPFLEKKPDAEQTPNPALNTLVRHVYLDGQLPAGKLSLTVKNLTAKQALHQVTTSYQLGFKPVHADKPVQIKGTLDMLKPSARLTAALTGEAIGLQQLPLLKSSAMTLILKQAQSDWRGQVALSGWQQLQGQINAHFTQVAFQLDQVQQPAVEKYLKPVLAQVKTFSMQVALSGDVYAPKVVVRSDLDGQLGRRMEQSMQQALKTAKAQLRTRLMQRARQESGALSALLQPLLEGKVQVDQLKQQLQILLQQQFQQQKQTQEKALREAVEKALPEELKELKLPEKLKLPF